MALPWSEVATSPEFLDLPGDQKEAARLQYFDQVVAPQVPRTDLPKAREQFDAATKDPGYLGEIKRGLIHGAMVTAPKMVGETAKFFGAEETGDELIKNAEARETAANTESLSGQSQDSPWSVRGNVYEAAENSVMSIAPGAAGAAVGGTIGAFVGGVGALPGALIGYGIGSLLSLPFFYGSQGQSAYENIKKAQLDAGATPEAAEEAARAGGHQSGIIEAGGELVADVIPVAKMFKPFVKPAAKAAGTLVKDTFFPGLKTAGKTLAGIEAGEVSTEMAQQAGEDYVEGSYGAGPGATWERTSRVIMPTALMSAIPGMAGAAGHQAQVSASRKALEDPATDQDTRSKIALGAVSAIQEVSPETSKDFALYAGDQIAAGAPITLAGDDFYRNYAQTRSDTQKPADIASTVMAAPTLDAAIAAATAAASGTGIINQARSSRSGAEMLPVTPADVGTVQGTPLLGKGVSGAEPVPFSREEVRAMNLGKTLTHQYETPPSELNQPVPPSTTTVQPEIAPAKPKRVQTLKDAVVRQGGINPDYRMDILGDTNGNYNIPGVGHVFTKTGDSPDGMAEKLTEEGWFTEEQRNSGDATRLLSGMLRDELTGIKEHINPGNVSAFDTKMKAEMEHYYGDQGGQEDPFVNAPPADLEVSGYNMADEQTKDLSALYAVGYEKMGIDAFDSLVERVAAQNTEISDNDFEKIIRQEIENHGKPQREAAAQKRQGAENRAPSGELVAPAQDKEGAAAPPVTHTPQQMPALEAGTATPSKEGVSVSAVEKLTTVSKRKPADYGSTNKIVSTERANELREKLRKKLNQVGAGIDPELFAMASELSVYHIEAGARSFAAYSKAMLSDLGDKIKPYLKALYLGARNWPGMDKTGMQTEAELETAEKTAPGQTADMLGGKNESQQAIHNAEIERQKKMAEAPPVEAGEGDLFSGKAKQTDIEDVTKPARQELISVSQREPAREGELIPKDSAVARKSYGTIEVRTVRDEFNGETKDASQVFGAYPVIGPNGMSIDQYEADINYKGITDQGFAAWRDDDGMWFIYDGNNKLLIYTHNDPTIVSKAPMVPMPDTTDMVSVPPRDEGETPAITVDTGTGKVTTSEKPIDERLVPKSALEAPKPTPTPQVKQNHEEQKFKVGERVVINQNHNEELTGRHGVVTKAERIGWTTHVYGLFGGGRGQTESSSSYTYHVKTDSGVDSTFSAADIEAETGTAPKVVDDVKMPEGLYTPRHALQLIEHSKGYIRNAEAAAERARKADKIEGHKKSAERYRKELDARTRAFEAWAALNPEEAAKVHGELSTAKADENWWNHELTPVGRENAANEAGIKIPTNTTRWNYIGMSEREKLSAVRASGKNLDSGSAIETAIPVVAGDAATTLKAAGLTVRKTKTNKGSDVWEVSGDTRTHKDTIKSMGGRWYGPKKVWSFYKGDPSERLAERLPKPKTAAAAAITETPPTPIPQPRDKEKTPFEEGQAAFSAGKTRVAPMAMSSEEMTEWYRGWDKANLAAPLPGEIDEQANEGRLVSEETTNAPAQQPNLEAGNRGGNIEARPAGRADSRPLGVGVEEGNLGAGTERGTAGENQEPGGEGVANVSRRAGGREEQPSGAPRGNGAVRDQSERRPVAGRQDFTITDADEIGAGGTKTKYQNNVAAIRLLKQITEQDRLATPEEQAILAKYVGWGGIKGAFDPNNKSWEKEHAELVELLTQEEFEAARRSILDAHYTSLPIVRGIWSGLRRMGFDGGRVLEPSVGVGNFFGLMPKGLRSASTLLGVELDRITGAIAHQLYQTADISSPMGFQAINLPSGSFDAVVGNPPFGSQKLFDANHKELSKFSIHNFFIAKALDKLRPGGVMGIVVSRYFLDAQDSTARQYIAERANILGAVRLPYTAFKGNANTEVVTDVIFLQKLEEGESPDLSWVDTSDIDVEGTPARVNQYYSDNPDNVLGTFARTGSMYGKDELTVEPSEVSIEDGIERFVQTLPENIYAKSGMTEVQVSDAVEGAVPEHTKVGGYFVSEDGKLARRVADSNRTDDNGQPVRRYEVAPEMPKATERRVRDLIGVRDALRSLMRQELTQIEDNASLAHLRDVLNRKYNGFVQTHGYINAQANRRAFAEDPDLPLLESLEPDYDPGISRDAAKRKEIAYRPSKAGKAAIFKKRVLAPYTHVTSVDNPQDALAASLNERGAVDLAYMEEITGTNQETLLRELAGLVYRNPETDLHETADEYLTGNVKAKLATAKEAVKTDKRLEENVAALEKVQPADVTASDISVKLGATWVPSDVVRDFSKELLGVDVTVAYIKAAGKWSFHAKGSGTAFTATWGTQRVPADEVIDAILNMRAIVVKDNHGTSHQPNWVPNAPETQAARAKAEDVQQKFKDWIWLDPKRRERLEAIWNNTMNTNRRRTYDGSHMKFPGMSPLVNMRQHQKAVAWRGIQDRQLLLDHTVGAGKTYAMTSIAMEMRRLGIARKPVFTVPNHLVRQWRDEFYHLYPSANILATTEKDFEKANRQRLFSRIATGDWDAVIVAHSSFTKIGMPAEQEKEILNEMLRELTDAIQQFKEDRADRNVMRDMERIKENLEAKLEKANAKAGTRDKVVTFDELGADALFVDEAHLFKNLFFMSSMKGVAGLGNPAGSGRAFDLFVKTRYLQTRFGGKGTTVFATGTPISNSLVEMYTMQRYLMYDDLKSRGIHLLDAWARAFGDVQQVYEVHPSGNGYRLATRFAKFVNMPELMTLYRKVADVVTLDDLKNQAKAEGAVFPVPKMKGGKPQLVVAERSEAQTEFFGVPTFGRDSEHNITFKYDNLETNQNKDTEKYHVSVKGSKNNVAGPFDSMAEAERERDRLMDEPDVNYNKGSILWKFENLRQLTKDSKGKINALSITNEARKAGLDYRLIDPNAPDFAGSKINMAVDRIVRVHEGWKADRGAQLVFCDLSVPKSAKASAQSQEKKVWVRDKDNSGALKELKAVMHIVEGIEGAVFLIHKRNKKTDKRVYVYDAMTRSFTGIMADNVSDARTKLNQITEERLIESRKEASPLTEEEIQDWKDANEIVDDSSDSDTTDAEDDSVDLASLFALSSKSTFSVYDDVKAKLIAKGIPENEIAFIHDYHTADQKNKLFQAVRDGRIRVLLGSTQKMGAGMNAQDRLVAVHHLDAPWRPSDLEQRNGRIIRQGNKLYERDPDGFEIEEFRYATKQTYDTRMWQIIEHKARGVEQLRHADETARSVDDISGEAASAADMKAAASGNPLILDEIKLRNEISSLEAQEQNHMRTTFDLQRRIQQLEKSDERYAGRIEGINAWTSVRDKNPIDPFKVEIGGKTFTERKDIGGAMVTKIGDAYASASQSVVPAGTYRGIQFGFQRGSEKGILYGKLSLNGKDWQTNAVYDADQNKFSPSGFLIRIDNELTGLDGDKAHAERDLAREKEELAKAQVEVKKPFSRKDTLAEARVKHREVVTKLQASGGAIEMTPEMKMELKLSQQKRRAGGTTDFDLTGEPEQTGARYETQKETPAITTLREAVQRATGKTLEEGSFTDAGLPESFRGLAEAVKKIFGKDVVFFRNNIPDIIKFGGLATGANTKNIYVNVDHKQPFVYVTGHELLHLLRKERPDIYYRLYQIAKQEFDQEAVQEFGTLLTNFAARNELLRLPELDKIHEEMLANFVGDQFARPDFWSKLSKTEPETFLDLARMVYDYLRRLLTMAKGRLGVGSYRSSEYFRDVERMRDAAGQALSEYAENHRIIEYGITAAEQDGGTMFAMTAADRERVIGDSGRQYTAEQREAMRRTGSIVTKKTIKESVQAVHKDAWKRLSQGILDQFAPIKDISRRAYVLMRLSKGATGAFEALMKHGKLSLRDGAYDADVSGGVLDRVFIPLGRESTDFLRWIAGNRAEQLAAEDREHLFSPEDIAAFKSLDQGTTAFDYTLENGTVTRDRTLIYRDSHKKFNEFNKNVLDMAEQSGLIDGESRSLWEREFYVPFYRVEEEEDGGVRGMNIKSGVIRQEAFKKLKGGEQSLNDLMSNTLMNWAHLIDAAAKNRAAQATIEAAELTGAARPSVFGEKNTVWFMRDGKKAVYKVDDPYLLVAISSLEYAGLRGPAMDALSSFKHWLTIGVTASPFFKVRNLIRDSMQAVATADLSYNVLGNVSKGYKLTHRERQEYVSAMAGGGLIRFGTMLESNEAARTRQLIKQGAKDEHILDNESKVRAFYDKYLEPAVSAYNELGNRGEEINRMALYDRMIRKGVGHAEASLAARDLLDFSMRGSWTGIRFLTQVVPFMNARAQGMYKLGRSAKEDPARFATVLGATALFSVALMAAYSDDDDWKKREDWDRDNYWWFKLGGVAFRIPKPFEIGAIATLAERGAELMTNDEMNSRRFMGRVGALLADNLSMNPIPQLAKPLIDIYANVDSFTGRPIESMGMERLAPDYRFRQSTSMPARAVSTAGNAATGGHFLSPVQVDHLVRGYFSWLGSFVVGGADMLARSVSSEPARPASDYWKVATGGMVSETKGAPSRYVTQMYDQAKIIEEAYGTWKEMIKEGKSVEAKDYFTENRDVIGKYRIIERVKRQQTKLNQMRRRIENSDLAPDVKRERINKIREDQDRLARQVSQAARF
jgi:N12 class adenine-specific DNA methylase/predicted RNA methylase